MKPLLDLELLNTFAVVVEAGGFKEASSRLYRSQAAVSMQIKRLEEHLGHRLLERSNQGIRLTEPGKILLGYIERLLRLNNETLSALSLEPLRGPVHFGIPTDYAQTFLKQFIPRIRDAFPELVPRITCGRSRKLREMITTGELDIAIVTGEPQFTPEKSLWSEALCWYASVGLQINAEARLPVAFLESDCALRDLAASDLKQSGLDYDPVLTSSDVANLYSAVESGMAIALLPESSVISSKVRPVQLDQLPGQRQLTMNIINAGTLNPGFHEPLQECILAAARPSHDRAAAGA
ncbi:LysR family transcriptional regulator [Marinobacter sp. ANT_B65]|uniref:LysR family transcriptional regulator n=1 Tax=Marinobacter sp. ANT_B65 TaxID=2039467 RepID=UPI000BBE9DAA|nr:LysR family transcriptional regulator [Marinobacter sp. ANT_B65]PCM45865.1 LysR family transcriptional regulator [Marinobacter sp. ANT_B65]